MNNYTFTHNGHTFQRISKTEARRAYVNGLSLVIAPCNMQPFNPWGIATVINRKDRAHLVSDEIVVHKDFDNYIGSFEYYNCTCSETGKYTAYYIPVVELDAFTNEEPTAHTTLRYMAYDPSWRGCV